MKKITLAIVSLLALSAAGAGAWMTYGEPQAAQLPNTVAVTRGDVEETVLASGVLEANSLVSVGAQVSGIVKHLDVVLGQDVAAGDPIAEIDSLDQENAVLAAEASLANISAQRSAQQASLDQAQKALDRATQMADQQLVSQVDYETAEAALTSAKAQVAALDAQIQQANISVATAKLNLSRTSIVAPIAGTVVAVAVQEGQTVSATQTAPTIVKIAQLDTMLIKAEISEADVTRVEAGQKVYFTILGEPDKRIEASLRSVEPAPSSIDSDTTDTATTAVYYNGIFAVPNPDHKLRISMTAQVTIVLDDATDALVLPASALGSKGPDGRYLVQVYDPATGAIRPQPISVGINNSVQAQVSDGLAEGDLVVASGTAAPASAAAGSGAPGMGTGGPPPMGL